MNLSNWDEPIRNKLVYKEEREEEKKRVIKTSKIIE